MDHTKTSQIQEQTPEISEKEAQSISGGVMIEGDNLLKVREQMQKSRNPMEVLDKFLMEQGILEKE